MSVLTGTWDTIRGNFAPLRYPNLRLYLGGQAMSLIGTWLQVTAQSWVVWQLTHSESALGIVGLINGLPILFLTPYAGVWIDRMDRRKLLVGTQIISMVLAFILAFLTQTNLVQIWHVYLLSLLLGIANALDLPAQQAFLGDLAGMADIRKAINLNIMVMQAGRILGPALAGLIVARLGIAAAFWLNGLSFFAVIASLLLVRAAQAMVPDDRKQASPVRQIADGITYVRTQPRLQDLFIFGFLLMFFFFGVPYNILPAVADKMLGGDAAILGALLAAVSVGALIALVFVVPVVQSFKRTGLVMFVTLFWMAFWLIIFAHADTLLLSMIALGMANIGGPTVMNTAWGLVQLMAPSDMRGRVIALYTAVSYGVQPLAAVWIGLAAQDNVLGVSSAIQLNAILLIAGAMGIFLFRRVVLTHEYLSHPAE